MLPGSTERAVTVSGPATAITSCIQEICNIMLEVRIINFLYYLLLLILLSYPDIDTHANKRIFYQNDMSLY